MKVAIKVEKQQMSDEYLSFEQEIEILKKLRGIPQTQQMLWFGNHNGLKVMVTKMLGFDLIYFSRKHKKFSQECVFSLARQMIEILENIHKKIQYIEIQNQKIYQLKAIQIRFFNRFLSFKRPYKKQKVPFIGTSRYTSIRDDQEILEYALVYLLKQKLPWMNYDRVENNRLERIAQMKQEQTLEESVPFQKNCSFTLIDCREQKIMNNPQKCVK